MGLISSNAQRNSDIVESHAHVIVNSVNFGFIVGGGFRKLGSLGPDFRGWFDPIFLQAVIPAPHLLPGTEAADLNGGWRKPSSYSLLQLFQLLVLLRFVFEIGVSPRINAASALVGNRRLNVDALILNSASRGTLTSSFSSSAIPSRTKLYSLQNCPGASGFCSCERNWYSSTSPGLSPFTAICFSRRSL